MKRREGSVEKDREGTDKMIILTHFPYEEDSALSTIEEIEKIKFSNKYCHFIICLSREE